MYRRSCIESRASRQTLYFTCQGVLTLKIRSPDRVSGLNVSQVPFSSNVSLERSNSRERFFDFCREPERTAFSLRTLFLSAIRIFFFSFLPTRRGYVSTWRSFILVTSSTIRRHVAREKLKVDSSFDAMESHARTWRCFYKRKI